MSSPHSLEAMRGYRDRLLEGNITVRPQVPPDAGR
jgi:hypothetical protein